MHNSPTDRSELTIERFVLKAGEQMRLSVLAGGNSLAEHGLNSPRVQKLGLALSGFTHRTHKGRIQIFGNSEAHFFESLDPESAREAVERLDPARISCVLLTADNAPPSDLLAYCRTHSIPLLASPMPSSEATSCIGGILGHELAPTRTVHGVLMEIFGIGVLLRGESGIGKSECALDLIGRGHRLVADDAVLMRRIDDRVTGEAPEIIRDHIEIRGLGIINARELFGVSVLAKSADIGLCIEFVGEADAAESDRLGVDNDHADLLGVDVPRYVIPVRPGRNLATLAETAVRVFVSRRSAQRALQNLVERHENAVGGP